MSPRPWFDTILLFYIVLLFPLIPESLGGFEGGWGAYFLSFYFDTFFGGGSYFLI